MNSQLAENASLGEVTDPVAETPKPKVFRGGALGLDPPHIEDALARARAKIAPLWPLKSFVAVNPFLGLCDDRFEHACTTMRHVGGADMLMPRNYYRTLIAEGRIRDEDLESSLRTAPSGPGIPANLEELRCAIQAEPTGIMATAVTVADLVDRMHGLQTSQQVVEEISKWCAAYWDEGQAAWSMPWKSLPLYPAWRTASKLDRTADVMGLEGFRELVASLPKDPITMIEETVEALGLSGGALDSYLHRALFSVRGWAAYARYLGWNRELDGQEDEAVLHVLAVRLAWDYVLFLLHEDEPFVAAWDAARSAMAEQAESAELDRDLVIDSLLQTAAERAFQRSLIAKLEHASRGTKADSRRPAVQAAFCIDVRSEVFRRALETVTSDATTIGFAGFFGFPIEYVPIGQVRGTAQCPVLLKPKFVVRETVLGADEDEKTEILGLRLLRRRAANAWKSFKSSAVSSFVYVETAGLGFAAKLAGDALGITRPVTDPSADGLDEKVVARIGPEAEPGHLAGRPTGFTRPERIDTAETMLRAMSLTRGFGRLVVLAGHGSTMVNNPHASGYDCGACGGNPGHANARVAAAILNDPEVRVGLAERDIVIPSDTWFLGCLHDTTTDEMTIFDRERIPASHADDLDRLDAWLREAGALARSERASSLQIPTSARVDAAIMKRSRDWSQVRPEWGLAGNAAFIAAPRERTRGMNLSGRAFLHDYDWQSDEGFKVLELILTAPMVVASWINLQYYGSSVNPVAFGAGNKVLHNVVGTLGVLEGNGGDLRTGLPMQALHDGNRFVHEPLRLSVFVEAPLDQIETILAKHDGVRALVQNGWLHLFALADEGRSCLRYDGDHRWTHASS
ncbi:MAG: DUF2309 domain-containing protein [Myxococcales bacterium]|jgi:hypothetical protein